MLPLAAASLALLCTGVLFVPPRLSPSPWEMCTDTHGAACPR
ncbi:MAG: hypothetical protein V8T36_07050 [Ruthenibacterium lactatiformans]